MTHMQVQILSRSLFELDASMEPADMLRVDVGGGKYTVIQDAVGRLFALRYGEPWRDLVGDNLVHAMACEIVTLREKLIELETSQ